MEKYRTSINRRGRGQLTVASIQRDVEEYLEDVGDALLAKEHLAVLSRHHELVPTVDVTDSNLNDGIVAFYADEADEIVFDCVKILRIVLIKNK